MGILQWRHGALRCLHPSPGPHQRGPTPQEELCGRGLVQARSHSWGATWGLNQGTEPYGSGHWEVATAPPPPTSLSMPQDCEGVLVRGQPLPPLPATPHRKPFLQPRPARARPAGQWSYTQQSAAGASLAAVAKETGTASSWSRPRTGQQGPGPARPAPGC